MSALVIAAIAVATALSKASRVNVSRRRRISFIFAHAFSIGPRLHSEATASRSSQPHGRRSPPRARVTRAARRDPQPVLTDAQRRSCTRWNVRLGGARTEQRQHYGAADVDCARCGCHALFCRLSATCLSLSVPDVVCALRARFSVRRHRAGLFGSADRRLGRGPTWRALTGIWRPPVGGTNRNPSWAATSRALAAAARSTTSAAASESVSSFRVPGQVSVVSHTSESRSDAHAGVHRRDRGRPAVGASQDLVDSELRHGARGGIGVDCPASLPRLMTPSPTMTRASSAVVAIWRLKAGRNPPSPIFIARAAGSVVETRTVGSLAPPKPSARPPHPADRVWGSLRGFGFASRFRVPARCARDPCTRRPQTAATRAPHALRA